MTTKVQNQEKMKNYRLAGKVVLITGGSGSWGRELIRQLLARHKVAQIRVFSRGELRQVETQRLFSGHPDIEFIIGDVRDFRRLEQACHGVDVVFHLAALKHLPVCERNPSETVATNITGAQNVIDASIRCGVERVVNVSTDKAVDPLSFYGVTKACAERLMSGANSNKSKTRILCIRSGNVIGSSGSVIPLFHEQIRLQNVVTITDERMTRYFLTLQNVVKMVIGATTDGMGGETFVLKMPAFKISDLAQVMIEHVGNEKTRIETIGIRPGEKMHEVLVSRYEVDRTIDVGGFYVILPIGQTEHPRYGRTGDMTMAEYNSETAHQCSHDEIVAMLEPEGWLAEKVKKPDPILLEVENNQLTEVFKLEGWEPQKK